MVVGVGDIGSVEADGQTANFGLVAYILLIGVMIYKDNLYL